MKPSALLSAGCPILVAAISLARGEASEAVGCSIEPRRLRCEFREDPEGIDVPRPRLSWWCDAVDPAARGLRQAAFRVQVASRETSLSEDGTDLWDSGKVASGRSHLVSYGGRPLESRGRYVWRVRLWDQEGRVSAWSRPATFSVGLLDPGDWTARWISGKEAAIAGPALPLFRREFVVEKPVRRATAFVCGLGQYELRLDGRRVGDLALAPGWTNYRKTCLYDTFDVTDGLAPGRHALGVLVGNGMYNVTGGRYVKFKGSFGPPKVTLELAMEHADGTSSVVRTDGSWKTSPGPIVFSCIYGGEDHDALRERPGWDRPGFDDAEWSAAEVVEGPGGALRSQSAPPVRVAEELPAVSVREPRPGLFVYDLGRNFSGRPRIEVRGPAGATVKLVPGELLDPAGLVSQGSSGGPVWFSYRLRGEGTETWAPRFTYYGFRYVQVEGAVPVDRRDAAEASPRIVDLRGEFLHASAATAGEFECSSPLLNRVHSLIDAAILSNLQSVLTDCPHREKLGWLEVSHLLAGGIIYNHDVPLFYAKVSRDMRESQLVDGLVPDIAPEYTVFSGGFRDSPEWGSACAFNPWHVYQMYGDASLLGDQYDVMGRYADYLASTAREHIVSHGLGDWYDIGPAGPGVSQLTSNGLTATAIYHGVLGVLAEDARLLGREGEARTWSAKADAVRAAFNRRFFDPEKNLYDRGSQTALAMPLVLGLVDEDRRSAVLENLVRAVRSGRNRVTAGDVGFSYVVRALCDADRGDVLFDMVTQTEGPGYAMQLARGATTLTEAWDSNPASSQNHCMLGHAEEWLYRGLAGIVPDPSGPGFERIILKPQVVGDLTWVKARYDSVRGRVESRWRLADGRLSWEFTVPTNTAATVFVPTTDPSAVREGGRPATEVAGLREIREAPGRVVLEAAPGRYRIEAPLRR